MPSQASEARCEREKGIERERLRGGGRREKKGGGDGGMVPTSTSARNCFFIWGGCIIMKAGAERKSTANIKSLRKQLKCHCFSSWAPIPDKCFYLSFCFHTSFQMTLSVSCFYSLSEGFSRTRLGTVDQMRVFQLLFHLTLFCKSKAPKEEGFWVSRGQDVCMIILELKEMIPMLKRDYCVLPAHSK